jgi:hypothetical protein
MIDEASGLVVSQKHPGIGWTHNDSGDSARVFAIDLATGATVASYTLSGIAATDWEDISLAPAAGDEPSTIYIADTGDNLRRRDHVEVHRFKEPDMLVTNGVLREVETMRIQYPDGARDVECLTVLPDGALVLLTKTLDFRSTILHVDTWRSESTATAQINGIIPLVLSGSARSDRVTGCDLSQEHGIFVVRTYEHVLVFEDAQSSSVDALLTATPCVGKLPTQEQGEAIAISRDTPPQLVLLSEDVGEPIWKIPLTNSAPSPSRSRSPEAATAPPPTSR